MGPLSLTVASSTSPPHLTDDDSLTAVVDGVSTTLTDRIVPGVALPWERTYTIDVRCVVCSSLVRVNLTTHPTGMWAKSGSFPDGPAVLPALDRWSWSITRNRVSDSSDWKATPSELYLSVGWVNATFVVTGVPHLRAAVTVYPNDPTSVQSVRTAYVLPQMLGADYNETLTLALAKSLHPAAIRWSQIYDAPATWKSSTGTVTFNFTHFTPLVQFTTALGAQGLLSLPAGSWGDANVLPAGMPLNKSLLVNWYGHSTGYFPNLSAYRTYVTTLAKDIKAKGWSIEYWNIGNEVPVWISQTYTAAFANVFNVASEAIHSVFPSALVGSDVLTAPTRLAYFASHLVGVGFLGFHFYPAGNLCSATSFCIPNNKNGYLTDSGILQASVGLSESWQFVAPALSRVDWHDDTGNWLPVLDEESNLNSAQAHGSDPRQQTLFDAAWLGSLYMTASEQDVSSLALYSLLSNYPVPASPTKAYGGWGFGAASETPAGAVTQYASYWAGELWGENVPAGSSALKVTDLSSYFDPVYAVMDGSELKVVVVNLVDTNATVRVSVPGGGYSASSVEWLDQRTYNMVYDGSTHAEVLKSSGLGEHSLSPSADPSVTLEGYGVAVLTFSSA